MEFNIRLHKLMWQNLARLPIYNKSEIIEVLYKNQEINFDEKQLLKNSLNNCLACQYSIEMIKESLICKDFEKPKLLCCYCPFKVKNQSSEECLDGTYQEYLKYRKKYIDLSINDTSNKMERSLALQQVRHLALKIAQYPLKTSVIIKKEYGI